MNGQLAARSMCMPFFNSDFPLIDFSLFFLSLSVSVFPPTHNHSSFSLRMVYIFDISASSSDLSDKKEKEEKKNVMTPKYDELKIIND